MVRKANRLIEELRECQRRHQALQHRLLTARSEFREALAAQLATPPNPPTRIDLERQLLRPLLELPLSAADAVGRRVFAASGAPLAPPSPDLAQLVAALCTLPVAHDGLGGEVEEHADLTETVGTRRFPDEVWDVVNGLLGDVSTPTRLSALFTRARELDMAEPADEDAVAHLLALHATHALDPGVGDRARAPERDPFLIAVADGASFEIATVEGDDVLLVPASLLGPSEEIGGF